jgi:hypothetical protein
MSSPILRLPLELLEKIVLGLHDDPASPPSAFLPLLLASKHFYNALSFTANNHLYACIFRLSFDQSGPARRLGNPDAPGLAMQLRANYDAIKCVRRRNIRADNVLQTFWTCFSMLLENDGKNRHQLDAAGLPDYVDDFLRERLYEHSIDGWPAENELNSLALWLLWLTTTEGMLSFSSSSRVPTSSLERLRAETPAQRAQMTRLILPYVLMPIRVSPSPHTSFVCLTVSQYAAFLAPQVHYTLPFPRNLPQPPHSFLTVHGPYPQYRDGFSRALSLYHLNPIQLGVPLASVAAKLIYFSHREVFPVAVPPHLPRSRAHAFQLGLNMVGPTQEDVHELNEHKVAKFVPKSTWEWWSDIKNYDTLSPEARSKLAPSTRWDDDWNRLADCNSVFTPVSLKRMHYTPGTLSGLWQGRMLVRNARPPAVHITHDHVFSSSLTTPSTETSCKHLRCPRCSASSPLTSLPHPYSCVFASTIAWMSNQTSLLPQAASKTHGSTVRRVSTRLRCVFQPCVQMTSDRVHLARRCYHVSGEVLNLQRVRRWRAWFT